MPHFDRLGNDLEEANAECAACDEEVADRKYKEHMASLVVAVRNYAKANYNSGGWDYVLECWEDSDICNEEGGALTAEEAIRLVGDIVKVQDDMRKDIQAEAGYDREQEMRDMIADLYPVPSLCTCQDAEDFCPYHRYQEWMAELSETGIVCQDAGYKVLSKTTECEDDYKTRCFLTQKEFQEEYDETPFDLHQPQPSHKERQGTTMKSFAICLASLLCGAALYHTAYCPTFKSEVTAIVSR